MVKSKEVLVATTLLCNQTGYEACEDDQGYLMMNNDIVLFMQDSQSINIILNVLNNVIIALGVGNQTINQQCQ